jgi:hypothetical protein
MSVTNEHTMAVQKSHTCQHPLATFLRSLSGALEYLLKFIVEFNHTSVGDLQFQFELTVFHGPPYDSREKGRDAVDPEAPTARNLQSTFPALCTFYLATVRT